MKKLCLSLVLLFLTIPAFSQMAMIAMNAPQGPRNPQWASFNKYIVPNIDGVSLFVKWSDIETSPGKFDFTSVDSKFTNFPSQFKRILILSLIGDTTGNAVPSFYRGKFQSVNCAGTSWFPVIWNPQWQSQTQAIIKAFIAHENSQTRYYDRISITQFGQSSVPCQAQLQSLTPNYQKAIVGAYQTQVQFEAAQHPTVKLQEEISCGPNRDCVDYADVEAKGDAAAGIGIGSGGAQKSDTLPNATCSSDWCAMFAKYPNTPVRMLQSYTQTDNKNLNQTGSLAVILPFARSHGTTSWEAYYQDLECGLVPNYSDGTGCHAGVNPAAYKTAIQNARNK
jgi:hypothetical protein